MACGSTREATSTCSRTCHTCCMRRSSARSNSMMSIRRRWHCAAVRHKGFSAACRGVPSPAPNPERTVRRGRCTLDQYMGSPGPGGREPRCATRTSAAAYGSREPSATRAAKPARLLLTAEPTEARAQGGQCDPFDLVPGAPLAAPQQLAVGLDARCDACRAPPSPRRCPDRSGPQRSSRPAAATVPAPCGRRARSCAAGRGPSRRRRRGRPC